MSLKSLIDQPDKLVEFINSCLKPKTRERKQFGEVFTPMDLVNSMLDKLPAHVWTDKTLKWLDPANGIGNFPIAVYQRLMTTLKDKITSKSQRKRHILENMLYMCELNKKNVTVCTSLFDINNRYKLNIHEGDFLQLKPKKVFNISKFDIIIGNPPYQKSNTVNNTSRGGTNNNLYLDFVKRSFELLKKDGYLLMIHPMNWRKINAPILPLFLNYDILSLSLNSGGDKFINVSVKTDYYVVQKSSTDDLVTDVVCNYKNKTYVSKCTIPPDLTFIPNLYSATINSVLQKIADHPKALSYECVLNSDCHKVRSHVNEGKTKIFKYKLYNTSGKMFSHFSSRRHKDQTKQKVIMSNSGKLKPFYDKGEYGTTQDSMYILTKNKDEANRIIDALNSRLFSVMIDVCKWGNFRNEKALISWLKYPHKDVQCLYRYFKLTDDEKSFVERL